MVMDFSGDFFKEKAVELNKPVEYRQRLDEYLVKLDQGNLPVIFSPLHWALMMDMDYESVKTIINSREAHYHHFRIRKKNNGFRYISSPEGELLKIQYWIKTFILDKLNFPDYLTSYQKGKSIIQNASYHVGKELVIKYDLKNFFGLFKLIGYNSSVAIDLAKACCLTMTPQDLRKRHVYKYACLPQGAPTSPALSNLAAFRVDLRLSKYAEIRNCSYSRYADDITFSGRIEDKIAQFAVRDILLAEGFTLNISKSKYVQRSNRQQVTGLTVNEKVAVPKKLRRDINTHLHFCLRFGPYQHLKRTENFKMNYREWLWGNILFIKQLHPFEAQKMIEKFHRINWL
jgi:RNA-directed DNA polymerase